MPTTQKPDLPQTPASERLSVWDRLRAVVAQDQAAAGAATDPAALAARLAERARLLRDAPAADSSTAAGSADQEFLVFRTGTERYGLHLRDVLEVQRLEHYSPVPGTPPFIAGVVQWRGSILALLDLDRFLGLPQSGIADHHVSIIVEAAGERMAVVAREVEDILSLSPGQVQPAPPMPGRTAPEWLWGVHDGNRPLLRMDRILQDEKISNWRNA